MFFRTKKPEEPIALIAVFIQKLFSDLAPPQNDTTRIPNRLILFSDSLSPRNNTIPIDNRLLLLKLVALQILNAWIKKGMPLTADMPEKGLIQAWQLMLIKPEGYLSEKFQESIRKESLNTFFTINKHYPPTITEDESNITESQKAFHFFHRLVSLMPTEDLNNEALLTINPLKI